MYKSKNFDKKIIKNSLLEALKKLDPRIQIKNPVMFIVYMGALLTTVLMFRDFMQQGNFL